MTNTDFNARGAKCPGCGAMLEFKVGSARVIVCDHCGYAVGRSDRGLENLGKVADLVPTGARIALGARGRYEGIGFTVAGRLQLSWEQGVWDEWHVALDDGRWGWLAEDDGRYFFSFLVHRRPAPRWGELRVGRSVHLSGYRRFVVTEAREACQVAAKGQLPGRVEIGRAVRYADLSGPEGLYATLDYADGDVPTIFVGREVSLDDLELRTDHLPPPERQKVDVSALICPKCRGPISLQNPDLAKQVSCGYCNALLDTSQGALRYLEQLPKWRPRWLGKRCTFFGVDYLTIGWMRRAGESDGETFSWEEYLLYDEERARYRFLCSEAGHWSFSTPIATGDVVRLDGRALHQGRNFKLFSTDHARVTAVLGEFFWSVRIGDVAICADYVAPPEGLSLEQTETEISWSREVYLQPEEVWAAYGCAEEAPAPMGVGAIQPSPFQKDIKPSITWSAVCLAIAFCLLVFFIIRAPNELLVDGNFPVRRMDDRRSVVMGAPGHSTGRPSNAVDESEPFVIEKGGRNLKIAIDSNVDQSWAAVSASLVHQETGEKIFLGQLESSRYHGEGSESWSEENPSASAFAPSVAPGRYVLRVESAWEPGKIPPAIRLTLTSGVPRLLHFFLLALFLCTFPAFAIYRNARFEAARWRESDESDDSDDDDDDDD